MTSERGLLERVDIVLNDLRHASDTVGARELIGELREALEAAERQVVLWMEAARDGESKASEQRRRAEAAERELDEARYDWNLCSESLSETKYRLGIAEQRIEALEGALREIAGDCDSYCRGFGAMPPSMWAMREKALAALAESGGG